MAESLKILVLGASGFVGRQLACAGLPGEIVWVARAPITEDGYLRIRSYDESSIRPLLSRCDVVVHLAALVRDRRINMLREANTDLVKKIAEWLRIENARARFIFLSSDLATYDFSPYGKSKKEAELLLQESGLDVVSLRASAIAGFATVGMPSMIAALKPLAVKRIVPLPAGGDFPIRPLWIEDISRVLTKLAARRGNISDRAVWSMMGNPITLRDIVFAFSSLTGRKRPFILNVPMELVLFAGEVITGLNPAARFPLDFLRAVTKGGLSQPPDIFEHLGLKRSPVTDFLEKT